MEEIKQLIKDINSDMDITFDGKVYTITHKEKLFQVIPFAQFDRETLNDIRKTVWMNENKCILDEIDRNNDKLDNDKQKNIDERGNQTARDMYTYGITEKKHFSKQTIAR